jgi:hypothetical protein
MTAIFGVEAFREAAHGGDFGPQEPERFACLRVRRFLQAVAGVLHEPVDESQVVWVTAHRGRPNTASELIKTLPPSFPYQSGGCPL